MPISKSYPQELLNYNLVGKEKVVVLLHGFLENSKMWIPYVDLLKQDHLVICPDLPGHGSSQGKGEVFHMTYMAKKVHDIFVQENLNEAVIIGHSMGGYVALAFAELFPKITKGLCLFHSHALEDDDQTKLNRDRTIDLINKGKSKFISSFIPDLFNQENISDYQKIIKRLILEAQQTKDDDIIASLKGMKDRKSGIPVLSEASFPVSFIIGKKDKRANIQQLAEQIVIPKISSSLILDNVGHMGHIEAFERTSKYIKSFIDQCI